LIGGVAALVLAGYATGRLDTPPLSTSAVGLALVVAAAITGLDAAARLVPVAEQSTWKER
jgi:hypothetical protein